MFGLSCVRVLAVVLAIGLGGCQTAEKAADHVTLTVIGGWAGVKTCFGGKRILYGSCEFTIQDIPAETAYLEFTLRHMDAGIFHTRETIPYQGGTVIAPGQFDYLGPCPQRPGGSYAWTVVALDQDQSSELASGVLALEFP